MRIAAKDHLAIECLAPYCSKLTTRKLPHLTIKKKKRKSYMNALNLYKICCLFPSIDKHKSLFINYTIHKKTPKIHKKKLLSQTYYKNHKVLKQQFQILLLNTLLNLLKEHTFLTKDIDSHNFIHS